MAIHADGNIVDAFSDDSDIILDSSQAVVEVDDN